jgi:hypothetical protein
MSLDTHGFTPVFASVVEFITTPGSSPNRPAGGVFGSEMRTHRHEGMSQASSLTLYEGLPHPSWEAELLKQELATKKTVTIRGFSFYERPLSVASADVEELRRLSTTSDPMPCRSEFTTKVPKKPLGYKPAIVLSDFDGGTGSLDVAIEDCKIIQPRGKSK